eukprot:scaffold675745_cov43-Prasinocladus_malaysianus.AAC.1
MLQPNSACARSSLPIVSQMSLGRPSQSSGLVSQSAHASGTTDGILVRPMDSHHSTGVAACVPSAELSTQEVATELIFSQTFAGT